MNKIITLSIPIFFSFLFIEAYYSHKLKKKYYTLKDSLGNLGAGTINQLLEIFTKPLLIAIYIFIYEHLNLAHFFNLTLWSDELITVHGIISWIIVFILTDLIYYFFHRHSHEINFLWALHMVHHSSEEYNFSVALRQSSFSSFFNWIYAGLLALIGVPAHMFFICYALNLLYQFFIHTRFIKNLGFLEYILNTPSHHRVHHARQGKYLDANYAGVLIIWDKLFKTFKAEEEEPHYGVYPRFQSYDPLRANLMPLEELVVSALKTRGINRLYVFTKGPLWMFEHFKKGKNLNIMDQKNPLNPRAIFCFALATIIALLVLNVQTMTLITKAILALSALFLFKVMGLLLDSKEIKF